MNITHDILEPSILTFISIGPAIRFYTGTCQPAAFTGVTAAIGAKNSTVAFYGNIYNGSISILAPAKNRLAYTPG